MFCLSGCSREDVGEGPIVDGGVIGPGEEVGDLMALYSLGNKGNSGVTIIDEGDVVVRNGEGDAALGDGTLPYKKSHRNTGENCEVRKAVVGLSVECVPLVVIGKEKGCSGEMQVDVVLDTTGGSGVVGRPPEVVEEVGVENDGSSGEVGVLKVEMVERLDNAGRNGVEKGSNVVEVSAEVLGEIGESGAVMPDRETVPIGLDVDGVDVVGNLVVSPLVPEATPCLDQGVVNITEDIGE